MVERQQTPIAQLLHHAPRSAPAQPAPGPPPLPLPQASIEGFAEAGVGPERAAQLLNLAVDLADGARQNVWNRWQLLASASAGAGLPPPPPRRRPLVAFSCGSYGAYLANGAEFTGDYAESVPAERLVEFHRARLEPVRARPEVDLLAFETVPCLAGACPL